MTLPPLNTDLTALRELLLDTPFNSGVPPTGPDDFGSPGSCRLNLKRRGVDFSELEDHGFGIYLGQHPTGWVVAIKDLMTWQPVGFLTYESLAELKQDWTLD